MYPIGAPIGAPSPVTRQQACPRRRTRKRAGAFPPTSFRLRFNPVRQTYAFLIIFLLIGTTIYSVQTQEFSWGRESRTFTGRIIAYVRLKVSFWWQHQKCWLTFARRRVGRANSHLDGGLSGRRYQNDTIKRSVSLNTASFSLICIMSPSRSTPTAHT